MKRILAIGWLLVLASCATRPTLVGQVSEGTYYAPSGKYSVSIPVDASMGGRVQDTPWAVGFTDDFGRLFRIEGMPLPSEEVRKLQQAGAAAYLKGFLADVYMPSTVLRAIPYAVVGKIAELPDMQGGACYAEIFLPKGSVAIVSHDGQPGEREDAVRGVLWFLRGSDIYIVSTQLAQIKNYRASSPEDEERLGQMLKKDTLKFAGNITFAGAP